MNAKRILAVLLVTVMTVSTLFACGGEGGKGNGVGKNTLTADECLNKIFENSLPKTEPTTVATTVNIISAGANDPYNRITYNSIVTPSSESYVKLEVKDPRGDMADISVYSGSNGAIVASRLFEGNYLVSVDFLKGFLADMGEAGQKLGELLTGNLGVGAQDPELVKLVNKYMTVLEKAMASASEKKLVIENNSLGVTVTFNGDSVKKIVKDLYGEAKKDETLKELYLESVQKSDPENYNKLLSEYEAFFGSEDGLNELFGKINEYKNLKLVFTVTADKSFKLSSLRADLTADGSAASFEYKTDKKDAQTTSTVTVTANGFGLETELDYSLIETVKDGADGKEYTLSLEYGIMVLPLLSMTVDSEGNYVCTVNGDTAVEGTLAEEEGKTDLTVRKVTVKDETTILNVTVTVQTNATLPKFPTNYKTLEELAQEELNALIQSVKEDRIVRTLYDYFSDMIAAGKGEALPEEMA